MVTYNWLTQNSKIKKMSGVKTYNWTKNFINTNWDKVKEAA